MDPIHHGGPISYVISYFDLTIFIIFDSDLSVTYPGFSDMLIDRARTYQRISNEVRCISHKGKLLSVTDHWSMDLLY